MAYKVILQPNGLLTIVDIATHYIDRGDLSKEEAITNLLSKERMDKKQVYRLVAEGIRNDSEFTWEYLLSEHPGIYASWGEAIQKPTDKRLNDFKLYAPHPEHVEAIPWTKLGDYPDTEETMKDPDTRIINVPKDTLNKDWRCIQCGHAEHEHGVYTLVTDTPIMVCPGDMVIKHSAGWSIMSAPLFDAKYMR